MIYSNMDSANRLVSRIPAIYQNKRFQWYLSSLMMDFVLFLRDDIQAVLKDVYPDRDLSQIPWRLSFKYTEQAAQFARPANPTMYWNFMSSLNQIYNIYILGADWTPNPGWVESCLESVLDQIDNI